MTVPDKQAVGEPEADGPVADVDVTKAAFLEAFGGVRGMVETTVPGLVFVLSFTVNRDIRTSAIAALVLSGLLAVWRLVRRDTIKHAFSGVFGVGIGAVFAMMSGDAKNFYLPGMLYTLGLAVAYCVSSMVGVPLLGLVLGPLFRENLSWRTRNPGRKRAYTKSSWAWGLILLAKSCITFPIYLWGDATQLGWLRVALGVPPFLLCVYLTWIFLAKAPPPIDVIAEMEAEEEREKEAKRAKVAEGDRTTTTARPADGSPAAEEPGAAADAAPPGAGTGQPEAPPGR